MIEHNTCITFHESSYSTSSSTNEYTNTTVKEEQETNSFYYCNNNYYMNENIATYVGESDAIYPDHVTHHHHQTHHQHNHSQQLVNDITPPSSNGSFDSYASSPLHHLSLGNSTHKGENISIDGTSSDDTIGSSFSLNSAISSVDSHDVSSCHPVNSTAQSVDCQQSTVLGRSNESTHISSGELISSQITFTSPESENKNSRIKSPCLPDTCKKCGNHFDDDRLLVRHMKVDHYYTEVLHFTEADPTDRQKRYDEWFKKQMNRTSLPKEMNGQYFKPYKCDICSRHYSYKGTLARHRSKRHNLTTVIDGQLIEPSAAPSDKYLGSFTCETCGFTAGSRKLFERHVLRKHFQGMQPYPCDQCNESFDRSDRLLWHRRQKHAKDPLFTCDKCGRSYRTKLVYERHQRLQHSGHQFKCKECPKVFKSYASFDYHRRKHKGVQGMKFICEFCGFRFWSNQNRRKHINKCHSDGQIDHVAIEQNAIKDWSKEAAVTRSTGRSCNNNNNKNACDSSISNGNSKNSRSKSKKTETDVKMFKQQSIYSSATGASVSRDGNGVSIVTTDVNDSSIASALIDNECERQDKLPHQRLNHFLRSPPSPPPPSTDCTESDGHEIQMNGNVNICTNGYPTNHGNSGCGTRNCINDASTITNTAPATAACATVDTNACHNGPSVNDEVKRGVHLSMQHARDLSNAPLTLPVARPLAQMTHTSTNDGQEVEANLLNTSSDTATTTVTSTVARLCPLSSPQCHYNVSNSPDRSSIVHITSGRDMSLDNCFSTRHLHNDANEPHLPGVRGNLLTSSSSSTHSNNLLVNSSISASSLGHMHSQCLTSNHLQSSFNGSTHLSHFHDHPVNVQQQLVDTRVTHGHVMSTGQHHHQHQHHHHHHQPGPHGHPPPPPQQQQQQSYLIALNNHLQPVYHGQVNDDESMPHAGSHNDTAAHPPPSSHLAALSPLNDCTTIHSGQENLHPISQMTSHPLSSCLSSSTSSSMDRCKMCFQCVYNMPGHLMNQHSVAFEALDYFLDL